MPARTPATAAPPTRRAFGHVVVTGPAVLRTPIVAALRAVDPTWHVCGDSALPPRVPPSLAIVTAVGRGDRHAASGWLTRGVEHLPVTVGPAGLSIGPLVSPGRSPCLHCVDARVRESLGVEPDGAARRQAAHEGRRRPALDPALVALAASCSAMVGAAALAGSCPRGVSLEASAPWPRMVQRRWLAHPMCPCGAWSGAAIPQQIRTDPSPLRARAG